MISLVCGMYLLSQIKKILANRSDRELHDKIGKTCLLIDLVIPDDLNINTKETENEASAKTRCRSSG
jgi:hypothetical protein